MPAEISRPSTYTSPGRIASWMRVAISFSLRRESASSAPGGTPPGRGDDADILNGRGGLRGEELHDGRDQQLRLEGFHDPTLGPSLAGALDQRRLAFGR